MLHLFDCCLFKEKLMLCKELMKHPPRYHFPTPKVTKKTPARLDSPEFFRSKVGSYLFNSQMIRRPSNVNQEE